MRKSPFIQFCYVLVFGAFPFLMANQASAGDAWVGGEIEAVLIASGESYGGCMARIGNGTDPNTVLPNCRRAWVSFNCAGVKYDETDPDVDIVRAYRMLDQAQMAKATGSRVTMVVTDAPTINGYCYVKRIDVMN
jgi:hypothetical protein